MSKYSFIVLHYNTFEETKCCINYIKQLEKYNDSKIIVVDNCSTDDSLEKLIKLFEFDKENIEFIENEFNVGFAKGNNIGYSIAKHKYNSNFIICLNSDVYIKQSNFLELINSKFEEDEYHILGPRILNLNNEDQNPVDFIHDDIKKIKKTLLLNRLRLIKSYIPIKKKLKNKRNDYNIIRPKTQELEDVALHGSCIVVSPKYIESHEFLFFPNTFLYGEEDILFYLSKVNKERVLYFPSVQVLHLEDASTNQSFGELSGSKKRFILKYSSESLKILKNLMRKKS